MQKKIFVGVICLVLVGFIGFQLLGKKAGDDWPKGQQLTILVPLAAGGAADNMARQIAHYMEKDLECKIKVENRTGASTQIGTSMFVKQPADGSWMLAGTQMYLSSTIIFQNADYKFEDFQLINMQMIDPTALLVQEDSPYKTFEDLLKVIQEEPGEIKCGTIYGGGPHLLMEILKKKMNLDYKTITYDSGPAYRTALLGSHIDFVAANAAGALALKGKARPIVVSGDKRCALFEEIPTFNEILKKHNQSLPMLGATRYFAVHADVKKNYPERFNKLVAAYERAFNNPEYQEFIKKSGEGVISFYFGPDESQKINRELHESMLENKEMLVKK